MKSCGRCRSSPGSIRRSSSCSRSPASASSIRPVRSSSTRGDAGDAAYILLDGEAEILVDTPDGELVVAEARRHAFVGEIAILIDIPRTATVRARTELTALVVTKETFLGMAAEFPDVAIEIMRELAQRLVDTTEQLTAARAAAGKAGSG